MNLFDVYTLFDVIPVKGQGCHVWDDKGTEYLDLYGGHAVISIGHTHPHYVKAVTDQLNKIGFYSNSVINPLQSKLAEKLGKLSGLTDYSLFLCNSGAEANENALKLASFHTGRSKVVAFRHSFHGRTSGAVAVTDNPKIVSPFNACHQVCWANLNDKDSVWSYLSAGDVAAVIIEGVQGVGGINIPTPQFLADLREMCDKTGTQLVLDEIQSGYGRTGKFFAYQHSDIKPDIVTLAKGIANGFPVGAIMVNPKFEPVKGRLGTTFGGNYLGMAAAIAVAEVYEDEKLEKNSAEIGKYLLDSIKTIAKGSDKIKDVRGVGLMIGIEFHEPMAEIRKKLLFEKHIFTGVAGANMIRLLPPLCLTKDEADRFLTAFKEVI
ncbi:MAG: aspartate aminotransferase family protein [Bacteroidales bacterium]|nr:aspartate aminotransferase family protein [Bacteroidales bacterium]